MPRFCGTQIYTSHHPPHLHNQACNTRQSTARRGLHLRKRGWNGGKWLKMGEGVKLWETIEKNNLNSINLKTYKDCSTAVYCTGKLCRPNSNPKLFPKYLDWKRVFAWWQLPWISCSSSFSNFAFYFSPPPHPPPPLFLPLGKSKKGYHG